jgi:hypothetical protein
MTRKTITAYMIKALSGRKKGRYDDLISLEFVVYRGLDTSLIP